MLGHSLDCLPWDGGAMPFYDDDEDMKMVPDMGQDINNRVGGGAGKRLSLAELQVLLMQQNPLHSGKTKSSQLKREECKTVHRLLLQGRGHMQAQFGVGLREAAANLKICPTTLKRACRRHGITRWPRRQLARLHREGSSRSEGSGDTLRTDWAPPWGPSSCGQPVSRPSSSGLSLRHSLSLSVWQACWQQYLRELGAVLLVCNKGGALPQARSWFIVPGG